MAKRNGEHCRSHRTLKDSWPPPRAAACVTSRAGPARCGDARESYRRPASNEGSPGRMQCCPQQIERDHEQEAANEAHSTSQRHTTPSPRRQPCSSPHLPVGAYRRPWTYGRRLALYPAPTVKTSLDPSFVKCHEHREPTHHHTYPSLHRVRRPWQRPLAPTSKPHPPTSSGRRDTAAVPRGPWLRAQWSQAPQRGGGGGGRRGGCKVASVRGTRARIRTTQGVPQRSARAPSKKVGGGTMPTLEGRTNPLENESGAGKELGPTAVEVARSGRRRRRLRLCLVCEWDLCRRQGMDRDGNAVGS